MQCNWQRARKSSDWQSKQRDVTCVHTAYMVGGPDDPEERTRGHARRKKSTSKHRIDEDLIE